MTFGKETVLRVCAMRHDMVASTWTKDVDDSDLGSHRRLVFDVAIEVVLAVQAMAAHLNMTE